MVRLPHRRLQVALTASDPEYIVIPKVTNFDDYKSSSSHVGRTEERSDDVPAINPVAEQHRCRSGVSLDLAYVSLKTPER